jgi:hypothetical protein
MFWRRRKMGTPGGDKAGVAQAESQLRQSEVNLSRDRREVIDPLRQEIYRNNIQELVERLLRKGSGSRGHGANPRTN